MVAEPEDVEMEELQLPKSLPYSRLILIVSSKGIIPATAVQPLHSCVAPSQRSTGCLLALLNSSAADIKVVADLWYMLFFSMTLVCGAECRTLHPHTVCGCSF